MDHAASCFELETEDLSTRYELLESTEAFLSKLGTAIARCERSVRIHMYTLDGDQTGRSLAQMLQTALGRGIQVHLSADSYSLHFQSDRRVSRLAPGTHMERSNLLSMMAELKDAGAHFQWTRGDHRKLCVIDGETPESATAFIGGANIADHHLQWHDAVMRLQGESLVAVLTNLYDRIFRRESISGTFEYPDGEVLVDPVGFLNVQPPFPPITDRFPPSIPTLDRAVEIIRNADSVIVELPYPSRRLKRTLASAAGNGADVALITSARPNRKIPWQHDLSLARLARAGVNVHLYPGMSHRRLLWASSSSGNTRAMVGSSALNEWVRHIEISITSHSSMCTDQIEQTLRHDISLGDRLGSV